ncbi:hypothetical protein [Sphingobacterium bovisgrunnientis]|uniref:hypothetical protein n=1 Tax=Sphingobacterium bovisgrunnientis TaxID=1874697 RepID=UPI0013570DC6|nr:hypothetical protein [Sphingobacterium bovisgrunnientis]
MRKYIYLLILLMVNSLTCFTQIRYQEGVNSFLVFGRPLGSTDTEVKGSKYVDDFKLYSVNGSDKKYLIRYNALKDLMEYKADNNNIIELSKEATTRVSNEFINYLLIDNNNKLQYHQILADTNQIRITKVISINYIKAKPARNTYEEGVPSEYKRNKDQYFIYKDNKLYPFDGKQNSFIKIFPSKTDIIKSYFKINKEGLNEATILLLKHQLLSKL